MPKSSSVVARLCMASERGGQGRKDDGAGREGKRIVKRKG